jgi:hypothetical protein
MRECDSTVIRLIVGDEINGDVLATWHYGVVSAGGKTRDRSARVFPTGKTLQMTSCVVMNESNQRCLIS